MAIGIYTDILIYFAVIAPSAMKIITKEVRDVVSVLDAIIEEYKKERSEEKRDWRTYEQQVAHRIRTAIRELDPLIEEAVSQVELVKGETRGRKPKLTLKQKVTILLIKHLFGNSNREMASMMFLFSLLSRIDVSYKTVERLYSDEEVFLALLNLHALILEKKGVEHPDCTGDGTGYALTIKQHYASSAQKLKDKSNNKSEEMSAKGCRKIGKFIFSFRLMDLDTRMYIGYGTSLKSEKMAFEKALKMVSSLGIGMNSIRIDRYYSLQKYVKHLENLFGKNITIYLIPKKNATIKGPLKWKKVLYDFINYPKSYLAEYFRRNQSESAFSEDKRRFGWKIPQKRPERIETNNFCTSLWHNMFWLGV